MRTLPLAGLLASFLAGAASAQTTVTLLPDQDGTLYESATGALANGAGAGLFAGTTNSNQIRRALLRFDVAGAVPAGANITSASLTLNVEAISSGMGAPQQDLHRIDQAWGEGTTVAMGSGGSGGASTAASATWIHTFFPGSEWTNVGGDFAPSPSASSDLAVLGLNTLSSAMLAEDVQDMLDQPAANFGWLLKAEVENGGNSRRFSSRESATLADRPALEITFTLGGLGADYCGPAVANSSGGPAILVANGSATASDNDLTLEASGVPSNQIGLLVVSQTQGFVAQPGTSQGNLCLAGAIGRFTGQIQSSGPLGTLNFTVDTFAVPQPSGTVPIQAGETWNFQAWYRDTNPASTSNFTQGVSVLFN